jgi:hypothetical protein
MRTIAAETIEQWLAKVGGTLLAIRNSVHPEAYTAGGGPMV